MKFLIFSFFLFFSVFVRSQIYIEIDGMSLKTAINEKYEAKGRSVFSVWRRPNRQKMNFKVLPGVGSLAIANHWYLKKFVVLVNTPEGITKARYLGVDGFIFGKYVLVVDKEKKRYFHGLPKTIAVKVKNK